MSKAEVRAWSIWFAEWDKPASPACLRELLRSSRTIGVVHVDCGEEILREMGFHEFRVRHHDSLVRLEISSSEMARVLQTDVIDDLARRFRELGFKYVTLDLHGFRSGAMNEVLNQQPASDSRSS